MPSKITFFIPDLNFGGEQRTFVSFLSELAKLGVDTDLLLVNAEGKLLSMVDKATNIIDLKSRNAYLSIPALVRYWKLSKPTVMISTLVLTNLIAVMLKSLYKFETTMIIRVSTTLSIQERPFLKKYLLRFLIRRIYPLADEIVAVSKGAAKDLSNYAKIPLERIKVIYNPIISDDLTNESTIPVDHPWLEPGQPPVILGVGRLTYAKSFDDLIHAFSIVQERISARLIILGDGEERESLEKLVKNLGISDSVELPGFKINPYPFYRLASVFVLSSRREGLPSALVEALACECPSVSTDCPSGPYDILDGGKYGELVPVGDVEAVAAKIIDVLNGDIKTVDNEWLNQFTSNVTTGKMIELFTD